MALWAGRFKKEINANVNAFNSSISFDARMYKHDIMGSQAHAKMLAKQGIISRQNLTEILKGLDDILCELENGDLLFDPHAEDIHMFIEAELTKRYPESGKKLHTARSRNDQVALDLRLYTRDEIKDIPISYKGAADAVSYRVILGNTRAINITEVNPKNADESWEERAVRQLFKMIRTGDRQSLEKAVSECVRKLFGRETSLQKYRLLIMEIITELFRFGSDNQLKTEQIFGQNEDVYGEIMRMESVEAVQTWLMAVSARMQDMILADRTNTTKSFVKRAAEYVKEHYSDQELSVEVVCKALGVSTSYFSTVFQKETGKTFVKYLTEFRMEKAAELLLTKEEKTYLIAQKAGYSDPNYFSYVFKRQFGVPPSKYRSWILKKKNGA